MLLEEFLKKVRINAGLTSDEDTRKAVGAVFDTLKIRLTMESERCVAFHLPAELKEIWNSGLLESLQRSFCGVEHMDKKTFCAKIAKKAGEDDPKRGETLACIVFACLNEMITNDDVKSIRQHLPADIRELWETSAFENETKPKIKEA